MKTWILALILCVGILGFVSADVPSPNDDLYKTVYITNNITNMNNFSDYVFVSLGDFGPCKPTMVGSDGIVPRAGGYRSYCTSVQVYAVKKTDYTNASLKSNEAFDELINSSKAVLVLDNVVTEKSVLKTSTENSISKEYQINLSQVQKVPNNVIVDKNYMIYVYILIPVIALIIVLAVIFLRKK